MVLIVFVFFFFFYQKSESPTVVHYLIEAIQKAMFRCLCVSNLIVLSTPVNVKLLVILYFNLTSKNLIISNFKSIRTAWNRHEIDLKQNMFFFFFFFFLFSRKQKSKRTKDNDKTMEQITNLWALASHT